MSKKIDIIRDQILISPFFKTGYMAITKNTVKKTNPKLLLELDSISLGIDNFH